MDCRNAVCNAAEFALVTSSGDPARDESAENLVTRLLSRFGSSFPDSWRHRPDHPTARPAPKRQHGLQAPKPPVTRGTPRTRIRSVSIHPRGMPLRHPIGASGPPGPPPQSHGPMNPSRLKHRQAPLHPALRSTQSDQWSPDSFRRSTRYFIHGNRSMAYSILDEINF